MAADLRSILKLHVPVIVQIGQRTMPVADVLNISPGAIIELPKSAEDELELLVNNIVIGTGRAVKVGENFGLRVSYVGDVQERVQALGKRPAPDAGQTHGQDRSRPIDSVGASIAEPATAAAAA